jgi:hypothetical protein
VTGTLNVSLTSANGNVSSFASPLTLKLPVKSAPVLKENEVLAGVRLSASGNVYLPGKLVIGKYEFKTSSLSEYAVARVQLSEVYPDIGGSEWYFNAARHAWNNALITGTDTGFEGDAPMTRAMLVTVLWRYAGEHNATGVSYFDVPESQWYSEAVKWATAIGLVNGYDGRFNPNDYISRQDVATILFRYAKSLKVNTSSSTDISGYSDSWAISSYAVDAFNWANALGLIKGVSGTELAPTAQSSRGQVAEILMRFIELTR